MTSSDDEFDFEQECIEVYRDAKAQSDLGLRIKALLLLKSVRPKTPPVKGKREGDAVARRVQSQINGHS